VSAVATRPAPAELLEPPERPRPPATLEERLELVLSAVREDGSAECPVCGSPMGLSGSAAGCDGCGSTLS
jgi:hypothetical protein